MGLRKCHTSNRMSNWPPRHCGDFRSPPLSRRSRPLSNFSSSKGDGLTLPAVGHLDLSPGFLDRLRGFQGFFQHSSLFSPIPRFSEHGTPREADIDPTRRPHRLDSGWHVAHHDGRDSPCLDLARDQTPGLVADRSDRDD